MPIQLVITGDHITDVFAEIQNFAAAIGDGEVVHTVQVSTSDEKDIPAFVKNQRAVKEEPKVEVKKEKPTEEAPKKLSREEQDVAVEEMIEAGEKDERFDLLTKGRQKAVEDDITKAAEAEKEEASLDDMFDDEDDAPEEVTADMVREKMGALGKDKDGNPIQDNLLKIRDILTKFVPKGEEIKVGKIPADKLADVYAELEKMDA